MNARTASTATRPPALAAQTRTRIVGHLCAWEQGSGLGSAVLASVDGFALAQASAEAGNGDHLAAMTSAMLGLAGAVSRELKLGAMDVLILEAVAGKVLMLRLDATPAPLLLMAACDRDCLTGNVLWSAKECGRKILAELGGK